jgi:murein DD-endopeptidase MepM/ murein hydrolase activator NlpD
VTDVRGVVAPARAKGARDNYGDHREGYPHDGIDVLLPIGTKLRMPFDGEVVWEGWMEDSPTWKSGQRLNTLGGWGIWTKVAHDFPAYGVARGDRLFFCHMRERSHRRKGDLLSAGDLIGFSGNTGASTEPHLHFSHYDRDMMWQHSKNPWQLWWKLNDAEKAYREEAG